MNRLIFLFLTCFPFIAMADSSMSFSPPPGDYSMIFLGNMFGVVDGVLAGTGSQMMGIMMGVFNSAVLALGGIVIMYIILVSTLNTAHEGQMLGQKWSSIWVPIRTTVGLALLIPKASGYCLMQIFVMWVVVQGVGVADKIWGAALDYLNRGGVIIQANMAPLKSLSAGGGSVAKGAATILYGQVCMLGLKNQLEATRESYLDQLNTNNTGPCAGKPSAVMQAFCDTPIPDFIDTSDPMSTITDVEGNKDFTVYMPQIDSGIYTALNGLCGSIHWNSFATDTYTKTVTKTTSLGGISNFSTMFGGSSSRLSAPTTTTTTTNTGIAAVDTLSDADRKMLSMSRTMAVSQMYQNLALIAKTIVDNDPQLAINLNSTNDAVSVFANEQLGVPQTLAGTVCNSSNDNCPNWGEESSSTVSVLMDGTEFQDAIATYNAIMAPALNMKADAANTKSANQARAFIAQAKSQGWILAGSYFYDLVALNGSATANANRTDQNSGLELSAFDPEALIKQFSAENCPNSSLCAYFGRDPALVEKIKMLLNGSPQIDAVTDPRPQMGDELTKYNTDKGVGASTVYGYVNNAMITRLASQPGLAQPKLQLEFPEIKIPEAKLLSDKSPGCGKSFKILGKKICFGQAVVGSLWDLTQRAVNPMIKEMNKSAEYIINLMVVYTAKGFVSIFDKGLDIVSTPGVNPIVGLAQMGMTYIDFTMNTWIAIGVASIVSTFIGSLGTIVFIFLPLILAWLGVMIAISFVTLYYIPFLPYMLFMFGAIAWLISVIEAIVAAPIVALGIAHPEGHDALGKSEQGLMILLNVFLRPGMMVIGFVAGIALSYVAIWIMNAGFQHVVDYLQVFWSSSYLPWVKIFGYFFASVLYITMYVTIVQQAFTLIAVLPDKVLRWIGGQAESAGQESAKWADESKQKLKEVGDESQKQMGAMQKQMAGVAASQLGGKEEGGGGGGGGMSGGK